MPTVRNTFDWNVASGSFGSAGSWLVVAPGTASGPPTANDYAEIDPILGDAILDISGTGVAYELDFNTEATITLGLTTTVFNPASSGAAGGAIVDFSPSGGLTVTSTWNAAGYLQIGGTNAGTLTVDEGGVVDNTGVTFFDVGQNAGATGTLNIAVGGAFTSTGSINVGVNSGAVGQVTVSGGGSLTTANTALNTDSDLVGWDTGSTGSVTVTGAGSTWVSMADDQINIGGDHSTGSLTVSDGGEVEALGGIWEGPGGTITVDATSILQVGAVSTNDVAGYLTVDANDRSAGGLGVIDANIIDNGWLGADAGDSGTGNGAGITHNESLTINGDVSGTGALGVGEDVTLVLNGSVSSSNSVNFNGWYGALEIDDVLGFSASTQIFNFDPGDTIDLADLPYDDAISNYSFTYSNTGNDLTVTEGATTVHLAVSSDVDLQTPGVLTLAQDGSGTSITFTAAPTTPFTLWSRLPNFFLDSSGTPIDGELWAQSAVSDGGAPIWVDTATPSSGYVAGAAETYMIGLTSQDWFATEQPLIHVATDTNTVDPFIDNYATYDDTLGNLGASTMFSSNGGGGQGAVFYWTEAASGEYSVEFQAFSTTYVSTPAPSGQNTVLTGAPSTLISNISQPLSWNLATNGTSSSAATQGVFYYATYTSATTEDIWLQAFNTSTGAALSTAPVDIKTVADGTYFSVSFNSSKNYFTFNYGQVGGSGGTGVYDAPLTITTGSTGNNGAVTLGSASQFLALPNFTSIVSQSANTLQNGAKLRFAEGFIGSQQVIQDFFNTGSAGALATIDLNNANPDHYEIAAVYDPNEGGLDYTALIYSDTPAGNPTGDDQVHLDLFNQNGYLIGSDYIIPNLTSFDQIHTLTGNDNGADTRVEIDYTAIDPNGGTQMEGLVYDTNSGADYYTLPNTLVGGGGEFNGSSFDDYITYAPGDHAVDGGSGYDTFDASMFASTAASVSINAAGNVVFSAGPADDDLLIGFSQIQFADGFTVISGNTLTFYSNSGNRVISTFNIAGQPYTSTVATVNGMGQTVSEIFYSGPTAYFTYTGAVSVQTYLANVDLLDQVVGGFNISDLAANVAQHFDTLNNDTALHAITFSDSVTPVLDLSVQQYTGDSHALQAIQTPNYAVNIVDTATDLEALNGAQIPIFVSNHVDALTSSNASVDYDDNVTAAIVTANFALSAPAGDTVVENFASGPNSSVTDFFGPTDDLLYKITSHHSDGTSDVHYLLSGGNFFGAAYTNYDVAFNASAVKTAVTYYEGATQVASETFAANGSYTIDVGGNPVKQYNVDGGGAYDVEYYDAPGTFYNTPYVNYDVAINASGVKTAETYYNSANAPVALEDYTANGGVAIYVGSDLVRQRAVQANGAYEAFHPNVPGTIGNVSFSSYEAEFTPQGALTGDLYYNTPWNNLSADMVASRTFTANGGFVIDTNGALYETKTVNADHSYEIAYSNVVGQAFTAQQNDYSAAGAQLAHSQDNVGGGGLARFVGSNLTMSEPTGEIGPTGGANDYSFVAHSAETFVFAAGSADDVLLMGSDTSASTFADIVTGFGTGSATNIVNLTGMFANAADLLNAIDAPSNSGAGSTVLTDAQGDTLTFNGVNQSAMTTALSSSRLGF